MLKSLIFAALAVAVIAEEYQITASSREQFRDMLKKQCEKNGAADKATEVETVIRQFAECAMGLVDVNTIKKEIEDAKPNGALDEVFKKYCAKTPQLKTCIQTMLDGITPCVDSSTRDSISSFKNGTDQLIDFVCYKDGDRIALFIAEEGPKCFQEQSNEIKSCLENVKNSVSTVEQAQSLTLSERCTKFDELTTCIVNKLEACSSPTPANMIESLMKYIRKSSPCPANKN